MLGVLIALRLAAPEQGWVNWLWHATPAPRIYKLYYHQYLLIVISGTIAGDYLRTHMAQARTAPSNHEVWGMPQRWKIVSATVSAVVTALVGLQARWLWQTTAALSAICLVAALLSKKANSLREQMVRSFILWGIYWLVVGLIFEPYEGGIKKDHPTLSYYLVTTGLAFFLLAAFTILIEMLNKRSWLQVLIDNGQNPMVAYVGVANAIRPVLGLTGVERLPHHGHALAWLSPRPGFYLAAGADGKVFYPTAFNLADLRKKGLCYHPWQSPGPHDQIGPGSPPASTIHEGKCAHFALSINCCDKSP